MSIFDDPRVESSGDGYTVTRDNKLLHILPSEVLGWGIYHGANLELVIAGDGPAIGYQSADDAVAAVLAS